MRVGIGPPAPCVMEYKCQPGAICAVTCPVNLSPAFSVAGAFTLMAHLTGFCARAAPLKISSHATANSKFTKRKSLISYSRRSFAQKCPTCFRLSCDSQEDFRCEYDKLKHVGHFFRSFTGSLAFRPTA